MTHRHPLDAGDTASRASGTVGSFDPTVPSELVTRQGDFPMEQVVGDPVTMLGAHVVDLVNRGEEAIERGEETAASLVLARLGSMLVQASRLATRANRRADAAEARALAAEEELARVKTEAEAERKRLLEERAEAIRRATTHPITHLWNKRALQQRAAVGETLIRNPEGQEVDARDPKAHWVTLFVDLDHFKRVNDELGHDTGDHMLEIVGKLFRYYLVRANDEVYHVSGDEFVFYLPVMKELRDLHPDDIAATFKARFESNLRALANPERFPDHQKMLPEGMTLTSQDILALKTLSATFGVSISPTGLLDRLAEYAKADADMNARKDRKSRPPEEQR